MNLFKRNFSNLSDEALIEHYQQLHTERALGELYQRYSHLIFGLCLKYLKDTERANDAVSSIFEKLMVDLKKHNVENFKSWLYMVARNHCLQLLRHEKTHQQKPEEAVEWWNHADSIEEKQAKEAEEEALKAAIQQLNNEQRMCIELFYLKQHSYREIEELTGLSNKQVKSYIQNGKRNLKLMLSKNESTIQ